MQGVLRQCCSKEQNVASSTDQGVCSSACCGVQAKPAFARIRTFQVLLVLNSQCVLLEAFLLETHLQDVCNRQRYSVHEALQIF